MKDSELSRLSVLHGSWLEHWVRALVPLLIYVLLSYGLMALMPIAIDFGDDVTDVYAWGTIAICVVFVFWYGKVSFEWTNDLGQLSWREAVALIVLTACICLLSVWITQTFNMQKTIELTPLACIGIAIAMPVLQEIVFRGFLFTRLAHLVNVPGAMILSSLAFAFNFAGAGQMIYAFIMGVVMSALLYRFRTLWIPIVAHVLLSMVAYVGAYFEVTAAVAVLCVGAAVVSGWWLYKTR